MLVAVVGTRPEAIKLGPVIRALRARGLSVTVLGTGQHTGLLAQTHLPLDHDLALPNTGDPLAFGDSVATALEQWLYENATIGVIVQGDTASAWGGARGGLAARVPIIHVEAGIRSGDLANPYPEEGFRRYIDFAADWHFCATEDNLTNLTWTRGGSLWSGDDGKSDRMFVVGNPGIDALYENVTPQTVREKRVMVTLHRRESFGEPLGRTLAGLSEAAGAFPDREFLWPVHPNPSMTEAATEFNTTPLRRRNVHTVFALEPGEFQRLLAGSEAVLTDSGGVQEEAAALGVPCVVARDKTDRPESVASGHAILAGRTSEGVRKALTLALSGSMPITPFTGFGDGKASERIADILSRPFDT